MENYKTITYSPENSDKDYKWKDFLDIAKNNEELAKVLVDLCSWQHPETVLEELLNEGEVIELVEYVGKRKKLQNHEILEKAEFY